MGIALVICRALLNPKSRDWRQYICHYLRCLSPFLLSQMEHWAERPHRGLQDSRTEALEQMGLGNPAGDVRMRSQFDIVLSRIQCLSPPYTTITRINTNFAWTPLTSGNVWKLTSIWDGHFHFWKARLKMSSSDWPAVCFPMTHTHLF